MIVVLFCVGALLVIACVFLGKGTAALDREEQSKRDSDPHAGDWL